ncbi:hypothetical protein QYM36_013539 [Artemia franciscana]|uniref:Uncharacterized protein n=1 Tax=Artemia franciscana TaxID=6661 RepID=A0AA88KWG1_ARTSF|nr:hypothetical protein QYM36_013539 [Artemia franciscana]
MNSLYLIFCFVLAIGQCDEVKQMEALEDKLNRLIETLDLRDEKQYDLLTRKVETQQSEINFLRIVTVNDCYRPREDGAESQLFISHSYNAATHFETTCLNVLDIFRRGTGNDFDFTTIYRPEEHFSRFI